MHPVLFTLESNGQSLPFGSYGAMLALALAVASGLTLRACARAGQPVGLVISLIACAIMGGFAGAWTLFVLVEWVRTGTLDALLRGGGLVFFGAVPGGLFGAFLGAHVLRVRLLPVLDLSVVGLACGHALGRLGCLLGGCCFGSAFSGPWAIRYGHPFAPGAHPPILRHPTPLYESVGLIGLAMVFVWWPVRGIGRGRRAVAYALSYSALRIVTELFRGDSVRGVDVVLGLSTSQVLSAITIAILGAFLLIEPRLRPVQAPP